MKALKVAITGVSALLMHSDRFANPLDPMAKAHKELTSKRKKTEADHEAIARSEWVGGLYFDTKIGPYLPTMNIRSCLVEGAKFNKLGSKVKKATLVTTDRTQLDYDGPRDIDGLWNHGGFTDCRSVKVGTSRLMRYRPMFPQWSCVVELVFDEQQLDRADLVLAFENAGKLIGLGDFRPACGGAFGRFTVQCE